MKKPTPLECAKREAVAMGWRAFPGADKITPQMITTGELCVHIWKNGKATLYHTEMYA